MNEEVLTSECFVNNINGENINFSYNYKLRHDYHVHQLVITLRVFRNY